MFRQPITVLALLILLTSGIVGCERQPIATTPISVPAGGMVFVSNRDGNTEIYVMNANGSNQTNLTNSRASEDGPVVSPDGSKILFAIKRPWPREDNQLYVMNADGSNRISLTGSYGAYRYGHQSWSPDSSRIAFAEYIDIYVVNADGSNLVNLTNSPASHADGEIAWSTDGSKIAFESSPPGDYVVYHDGNSEVYGRDQEIYVMNADGSNQTNLTNSSRVTEFAPVWSPDGSKIIFLSFEPGNYSGETHVIKAEIHVINADGSNRTNLTNDVAANGPMAWSPDGTRIAFYSSLDGNTEIYVMNADGSNQVKLTDIPTWYVAIAWSHNGSRIAFVSSRDGNLEIYVMNADGSELTNLTNNPAYDAEPVWLP